MRGVRTRLVKERRSLPWLRRFSLLSLWISDIRRSLSQSCLALESRMKSVLINQLIQAVLVIVVTIITVRYTQLGRSVLTNS
jgi:hypothetical protein